MNMKKILFIAISALATLFVSCDMEKLPTSALEESIAIQTMEDVHNLRVSTYTPVKGLFGGFRWVIEDVRGGLFNAMADFGNYYGLYYTWDMQTNDQDAESVWYADYSIIGAANYNIGAFEKMLAKAEEETEGGEKDGKNFTTEDVATLKNYIAEAYMTRVMAYWDLVTKFCVAYDPATAASEYGLPLQLEYAPTSDASKYPGRSSLQETYNQILSDLEKALGVTNAPAKNSHYWTIDAVNAMRARVLLNMKNYEEAATVAQNLINSGTYALTQNEAEFTSMWLNDFSNENIFLVAANLQDPPTSTGSYFIYDNEKGDGSTPDPQYIPSQTLLDLYGEGDVRPAAYFATRDITVEGAGTKALELLFKFQGNPALRSGAQLNYVSAGKPFRIAEQYLIVAEACAQLGQVAQGAKYLNDFRRSRIAEYSDATFVDANHLMGEVKNEWNAEFVAEGLRMINMKRWGDNVKRGVSQDSAYTKPGENYDELNRFITDSRCIWPIPKTEIDANPQIKAQQNPGYSNQY